MLPLLMPLIGAGISAISSAAAGASEIGAAGQQKGQASNLRNQSNALQVEPIQKEFLQKYSADQLASQSNMPGFDAAQDLLAQNTANHLRAIRDSSPTGASAVNAISLTLGGENQASNQLGIANAGYKSDLAKDSRNDLWNIGLQKRALELYRNQERGKMLEQANNLEAAATANKQTGINTITGALGSTGSFIAGQGIEQNNQNANNKFWSQYLKSQQSAVPNFPGID